MKNRHQTDSQLIIFASIFFAAFLGYLLRYLTVNISTQPLPKLKFNISSYDVRNHSKVSEESCDQGNLAPIIISNTIIHNEGHGSIMNNVYYREKDNNICMSVKTTNDDCVMFCVDGDVIDLWKEIKQNK